MCKSRSIGVRDKKKKREKKKHGKMKCELCRSKISYESKKERRLKSWAKLKEKVEDNKIAFISNVLFMVLIVSLIGYGISVIAKWNEEFADGVDKNGEKVMAVVLFCCSSGLFLFFNTIFMKFFLIEQI